MKCVKYKKFDKQTHSTKSMNYVLLKLNDILRGRDK